MLFEVKNIFNLLPNHPIRLELVDFVCQPITRPSFQLHVGSKVGSFSTTANSFVLVLVLVVE